MKNGFVTVSGFRLFNAGLRWQFKSARYGVNTDTKTLNYKQYRRLLRAEKKRSS